MTLFCHLRACYAKANLRMAGCASSTACAWAALDGADAVPCGALCGITPRHPFPLPSENSSVVGCCFFIRQRLPLAWMLALALATGYRVR